MQQQKQTTEFFVVVRRQADGVRWQHPLTKALHSRFQMRKALRRLREKEPEAQGVRIVSFC